MFDARSTFQVEKLHRPSRRELEERFLGPRRPVIITGAMDDWPVMTRWTNAYLKEKVGARTVHPSKSHEGSILYTPKYKVMDSAEPMKVGDYIDLVTEKKLQGGEIYAAAIPIKEDLPELWSDLSFPSFIDRGRYSAVKFWLGPGRNYTPLHYDASDNFLTQIRGKKQIILCPPEEIDKLYPYPVDYVCHHVSQVNVTAPDLAKYPEYARAERSQIELHQGEMLFIPFYWWHAVWGIDENLSINYWWRPTRAELLQHPRQAARGLGSQVVSGVRNAAWRTARKVMQRS